MKRTWCVLLLTVAASVSGKSQNPVQWTATSNIPAVRAGAKFTARVSARIEAGWHIYSITQGPGGPVPTEITVVPKQPFTLDGFVIGPLPHSSYDENFQIQTDTYSKVAAFKVPVIADTKAPAGANALAIDVRFQACNDRQCLPAKTVHHTAPVRITTTSNKTR